MYTYNAKLIRVLDGDTIEVDLDLGFDIHYIAKVRMAGINAPEMKTPQGPISKAKLIEYLSEAPSMIINTKVDKQFEKFGRVLGTITVNGVDINQRMITEGFAKKY